MVDAGDSGNGPARAGDVAAARGEIQQLLRAGEPLLAYNAVKDAREQWPDDLRLRQLEGLALARSGAARRAAEVLEALLAEGHRDGETLGLLGRTRKDQGLAATDPVDRHRHLGESFAIYHGAYLSAAAAGDVDAAYYNGINAATLALLLGDARATAIAGHVEELCTGQLAKGGGEYWLRATLGEAALIRGDATAAEAHYRRAAAIAAGRHADLSSTRRQARLLLAHRGETSAWLDQALAVPPVLAVTGHMVDAPGRSSARFPAALEETVRAAVGAVLDRVQPMAVYGQAACGADLLCLEGVLARGGEVHVVLPFPPADFRATSVDLAPGWPGWPGWPSWGDRFEAVLARAGSVTVTSDHRAEGSTTTYHYANLVLTGLAALRARALETPLVGLAVWDGKTSGGPGGTADVVELWRRRGIGVEVVDLAALAGLPAGVPAATPTAAAVVPRHRHELKAMLFADAVGYSKMSENQIPVFVERFLGAVAGLNRSVAAPPIHMEVAGDGLYFVFDQAADAGRYGLALSELVSARDWSADGLPANLDMRVGLHCGPVFVLTDPITGGIMYTGPHTSRTARIEPITPPGHVYASSAFAAVAMADGVDDLSFDYVGRTPLAKKYGALTLYHVRRAVR